MKKALSILINYLTCTDPVIQSKWADLLASFWHKDQGKLVTKIVINDEGGLSITVIDGDGNENTVTFDKYFAPNSQPVSYIDDLQDLLNNKVDKITGKGLSTQDFTTELKNKLIGLENYVHPEFHQISEVEGLQDALDSKIDVADYEISQSMQNQNIEEIRAKLFNTINIEGEHFLWFKKSTNSTDDAMAGEKALGSLNDVFYKLEYNTGESGLLSSWHKLEEQ